MFHGWSDRVHVTVDLATSIKNLGGSKETPTSYKSEEYLQEREEGAKKAILNLSDLLEKIEKTDGNDELIDAWTDCFYLYSELDMYLALGIWEEEWFSKDPDIYDLFASIRRKCADIPAKLAELNADYEENDFLAIRLKWIFEAYGVPCKYLLALERYYEETLKKADKYLFEWIEKEFGIVTKKSSIFTFGLPSLAVLGCIPFLFSHLFPAIVAMIISLVVFGVAGYLIDDSINEAKRKKTKEAVNAQKDNPNRKLAMSFFDKVEHLTEVTTEQEYPSVPSDEYLRWAACIKSIEEFTGLKTWIDNPNDGDIKETELVGFCNQGMSKLLWQKGIRNDETLMYLIIDLLEALISSIENGTGISWLVPDEDEETFPE